MPTRPYSPMIVGTLWPTTPADAWSDVAQGLSRKASELTETTASIRRSADGLGAQGSGQTIEAMCDKLYRIAQTVQNQADLYDEMSKAVNEVAQLIYHAREELDEIDRAANEEIQRLKDSIKPGIGAAIQAGLVAQAIAEVIAQARAAAEAVSAKVAAEITSQAARIGADPAGVPSAGGNGRPLSLDDSRDQVKGVGGGPLRDGMPTGMPLAPPPEDLPGSRETPEPPGGDRSANLEPVGSDRPGIEPDSVNRGDPSQGASKSGDGTAAEPVLNTGHGGPASDRPAAIEPQASPSVMPPMSPLAPSTGGGGGSGVSPLSGGSGFKPPATGLPSSGTGMSSAGMSPLSNPAGGLTPPSAVSPASGAAPTGTDFSSAFNAGLGAGGGASSAPLLPPPAAAQPPSALPSTSGAYGSPVSGPAPVSAAAGSPASAAPPPGAVPASAGPMGTPMVPPAASAGPLPPFNSDIPPRQAQVVPASGPPPMPTAPPAATGAAAGPPLPAGVVASGVGATAAGAAAGARSSAPDPLLQSASQLVYELMHASRMYGCVDWCVGVFKTPSGAQTVLVSSEGASYIPAGVFVPRSARMLVADPGVSSSFHARWFGWVNPAQTMLAYAGLCTGHDPNIELWAIAVSTDHGGSVAPARDAGVRHYEDCSLLVSPIKADAPPAPLDETRMHRLETLDRGEYVRLTGIAGVAPDRSQVRSTTQTAVRTAVARASSLLGFSVPPVIRHMTSALDLREAVSDEQWGELGVVRLNAALDSASQRPGRMPGDAGPSPYARAHHNLARTAELLALWRGDAPEYAEIAYTARQIMREAELWPDEATE